MICPVIQFNNQKTGLLVTKTPATDAVVSVANGSHQKAGVRTDFAGGLYDLDTVQNSLQTSEYAFVVLAINPMADRTVYVVGSPSSAVAAGTLTVLNYDPSTGAITVTPNLDADQELVGLYVKDENGTTYEITGNSLSTDSPISPSSDTLTIADGPSDSPVDSENPFFAGKTISIVGQGLDAKIGGHKENVHYLTVATKSPGNGYAWKTDINGASHNYKSTIEIAEALVDDEIGIDLTTTMYVHWRGSSYQITNVEYASPYVKIEIKHGPTQMEDGDNFWVAPYAVAPDYGDDFDSTVPATIPCIDDDWVPLAAIIVGEPPSPNIVSASDIWDLRDDFNIVGDAQTVDFGAKDIVISGDTSKVVIGQIYVSTVAPTATNDSQDSAGLGTTFQVGAMWLKSPATAELYVCSDSTPNAAVWDQIL